MKFLCLAFFFVVVLKVIMLLSISCERLFFSLLACEGFCRAFVFVVVLNDIMLVSISRESLFFSILPNFWTGL